MIVKINKDSLLPYLIYNLPIKYDNNITLCPVTMKDVLMFQSLVPSITVRKNSIFRNKKIIKMSYLEFLQYAYQNQDLEKQYNIYGLSNYFIFAIQLLLLCCKDSEVKINQNTLQISINDEIVTSEMFDDLRRIIIIQNDIDFDIDDFINYDTEKALKKASQSLDKNSKTGIEDYIDSLVVALNISEETVMNMTIRKFWRYIKRFNLHEKYVIMKTGECSGMVTYKQPIKHWMICLEEDDDKYRNFKTTEEEIRNKII